MANEEILDDGIAIWFPGFNSFTGEEIVELQVMEDGYSANLAERLV